MPNFSSVDDGRNFYSISLIDSFGLEQEESRKGGTWIKLKDGNVMRQPVNEVAAMLGSVNLWH